jgi:hypothetical protein
MLVGCAEGGEPKIPFGIMTNQVLGKMPFGNSTYLASAKPGYHFLVVAVTEIKKDQKISSEQMKHAVLDERGTNFTPIAFGMPHIWGKPFIILGYSFEGDIASVDPDVNQTLLALYYLVPTSSKTFKLKNPKGESVVLPILSHWEAPKQMQIFGYQSYGEVKFGTPTIKENGWGLKSSD